MRRSRWLWVILVSVVAMLIALGAAGWRLHKSRTHQLFGELLRAGITKDSLVALTFDDGPVPGYTDSVLAILADLDVRATFFVVGSALERHHQLAQRVVAAGHELGNHSYSHQRMVLKAPGFVRREVEVTDSLIRAVGQTGRIHFRPPYGKRLVVLPWYLARTNRTTVLWTLEPDSWYSERDEIVAHVMEEVGPGSIILMHVEAPARRQGRAALSPMIEGLRAKGYEFVTLSALLAAGPA